MWHRTDSEIFQEAMRQSKSNSVKVDGENRTWGWSVKDLAREISRQGAHAMAACKPKNHDDRNWIVLLMGDGQRSDELLSCRMDSLSVEELERIIEAKALAEACESPKAEASQAIRI